MMAVPKASRSAHRLLPVPLSAPGTGTNESLGDKNVQALDSSVPFLT